MKTEKENDFNIQKVYFTNNKNEYFYIKKADIEIITEEKDVENNNELTDEIELLEKKRKLDNYFSMLILLLLLNMIDIIRRI